MGFPTPPPVKEKPPRRDVGAFPLKHPGRAWFIIGASMAFWALLLCAIVGIAIFILSFWLGHFPWFGAVAGVLVAIAVWYGLALGWRIGSAMIIVALRDTSKT